MELFELEEKMKRHAKNAKDIISVPLDLKKEINKVEEKNMNKIEKINCIKRIGAIAAIATLCLVTVVTATPIKGFFKDIIRFDGAVIGTEYANATNELKITVLETEKNDGTIILPLEVEFINKDIAPFSSIEKILITNYKILDKDYNKICDMEESLIGNIASGKTLINIPLNDSKLTVDDNYFIAFDNLKGLSKADAPLEIKGDWNIEFIK